MDLRQLSYFVAVAEARHFGRAAERLHMAQPPLSRQIKALEDGLGTRLFERTPKGVELTGAGQTLLAEAGNLLALAQLARERTILAGRGLTGRLDVALFGSGVLDVIPRILSRFRAARPEVRIVLHTMTKAEQLVALDERRISVGFNRLVPPWPGLVVETVLRERMQVALPPGHPLAGRARLRLRDLEAEPLILYPSVAAEASARGAAGHASSPDAGHDTDGALRGLAEVVTEAFRKDALQLRIAQEVDDVLTAVALVAGGFGLAITTQSATSLRLPGVEFRPLASEHLRDVELSCLYRQDDHAPVLRAFLEVVRGFAREQAVKARKR